MMKNLHDSECQQCTQRETFYEKFSSDSEKDVSYFGVISYLKEKSDQNYVGSNICFLQLINEWTVRDLVSKRLKQKKRLISNLLDEKDELLFSRHFKEKKRNVGPKIPFYLPEHTGNLISIKKSESFSASSPDDSVCSNSLKTTNIVYKCHLNEISPSKEKVAKKEPKVGTLRRKRWNWEKLKSKESYEDDLFEEKKLKRIRIVDSSEESKCPTPVWSVQLSPQELSRSPSYEDCYNLTELQTSRKDAEEYQHRRNKKKKYMSACKKDDPDAVMKSDPTTYKRLMDSCDKLLKIKEQQEQIKAGESDAEKDHYFSDLEDSDN